MLMRDADSLKYNFYRLASSNKSTEDLLCQLNYRREKLIYRDIFSRAHAGDLNLESSEGSDAAATERGSLTTSLDNSPNNSLGDGNSSIHDGSFSCVSRLGQRTIKRAA